MNMKEHILAALSEQLERWETLLENFSVEQIMTPRFDHNWSIKDVIAHLWGWQQISVARMEAAALNQEPKFPNWITDLRGWEENASRTNDRIYEVYHEKSWAEIHQNWQAGFLHLIESAKPIQEKDLLDGDRYSWLKGYSLALILIASYDHHQEHFEKLNAAL